MVSSSTPWSNTGAAPMAGVGACGVFLAGGVPKMPEILSATRLLDSGQKATLSFSGIFDEGTHEYVCTYPNHWPVMWGQLIVTKDVDGYLEQNPEAVLPADVACGQHEHHHN